MRRVLNVRYPGRQQLCYQSGVVGYPDEYRRIGCRRDRDAGLRIG
jgi:hypothetical protein